ncbi:MAG: hypothetical protein ABI164_02180 [Acidobacteriaceae bacterium]
MVDFRQSFKKAHEKGISQAASAHLDIIRGLAALVVLIAHARHLLLEDWGHLSHHSLPLRLVYGTTEFGHQAVIVFLSSADFLLAPAYCAEYKTDDGPLRDISFIVSFVWKLFCSPLCCFACSGT